MWCGNCQLDVPAIASAGNSNQICCARCRQELGRDAQPAASATPDALEDWDLTEELHEIERLVGPFAELPEEMRTAPTQEPRSAQAVRSLPDAAGITTDRLKTPRKSGLFSWVLIGLGVMACAFGGGLIVWSLIADRPELWQLGLPVALLGQGGLLAGLVLQLDGLWQNSRQTATTLCELDAQLQELRQATNMLATTHSSSAQAFYAHLAEGASPQLLLSDLKGQMDLLATRLAQTADRAA